MNPYTIPGITRKKESETEKIKRKVEKYYDANLKSNIWARQVAMWIVRNRLKKSFQQIGEDFNVNHDAARYGCKRVKEEIEVYEEKRKEIHALLKIIYP